MKKLSIIAIILSLTTLSLQVFIFATSGSNATESPNHKQTKSTPLCSAPDLPDSITFAGEKVPLDDFYVYESLDRELVTNMYRHSATILVMKRAYRFFPVIEPILKKNGVPMDFKYLCVCESDLTNATSPAKAQGFWQFMKATGTSYGLEINDEIDMRNNLEAATEAACKYLKDLKRSLGSWTSAAAAYNCGEGGLRKRLNEQGVNSYYCTLLNSETTRYVYRILSFKIIMGNPQKYGFYLRNCDMYPKLTYKTVELKGQNVDIVDFAKKNGTNYKVFRTLNPWILGNKLTNKANRTYTVKIPGADGISWSKMQKNDDKKTDFITRL